MDQFKDLEKARKEKGLSQIEVAKKIGVSANTYRNWEYGANEPNEENLIKLLRVFGKESGEQVETVSSNRH